MSQLALFGGEKAVKTDMTRFGEALHAEGISGTGDNFSITALYLVHICGHKYPGNDRFLYEISPRGAYATVQKML